MHRSIIRTALIGLIGVLTSAGCTEPSATDTLPVEIAVSPDSAGVYIGQYLTLSVSVKGATNPVIAFRSENVSVATVDASGRVLGLRAGEVVIVVTVTSGSRTTERRVPLAVIATEPLIVTLNPQYARLQLGDSLKFTFYATGVSNPVVKYRSYSPEIVSVTNDGVVHARAEGDAVITGIMERDTTVRATAIVTVTRK